ncbi:glutamate--tRNA ligase [Candidatus Dojkabacteria bacterium]|nr:glutamate--tRNA ligase [Candidatus Dojkabacteria bacterium]
MKVKTRFAPSPTGFLHIGGVRTALYSYALARKHNGKFILRIEDTDKKREVEGGVQNIIDMLNILGLEYDEGPIVGGPNGPYIQSKRLKIYQKKAEKLVEDGKAYYCFCSEDRLEKLRKKQIKEKKQPMYDKKCRDLDPEEARTRIEKGEEYVIRLKIPQNKTLSIDDAVMGHVEWNSNDVDDQVLLKSDGFPTYHLGVVVDDVLMGVTHITRGIEWLASVPKHLVLFDAFGIEPPVMAHMPVILDPDGGKLSKRKGTVSTEEFLKEGYLPEALLNFLMLLGWSAPLEREYGEKEREFFSLEDFVELFSLEELNKASPVFNRDKLIWFNHKYINNLSPDDFVIEYTKWLNKYSEDENLKNEIIEKGPDYLETILELVHERVELLSEISDLIYNFYFKPETKEIEKILKEHKHTKKLKEKEIQKIISEFSVELNEQTSIKNWGHDNWESCIRDIAKKLDIKAGQAFMTLRILTLGSPISPPLFESMEVLGKDEVAERLK